MVRSAQLRIAVRTILTLIAVLVVIIGLKLSDKEDRVPFAGRPSVPPVPVPTAPAGTLGLTLTPDIYANKEDGYALTFPRSWRHQYTVTDYGSFVRVEMIDEGSSEGFPLFSLTAYSAEEWRLQESLLSALQPSILTRVNGRIYVSWREAYPTEHDLSNREAAQWRDMEKEIPDILSTFRLASSSQQTEQSPEASSFDAPFELHLREATMFGGLRLMFSETTFPLAELPPLPPEEEPYVHLKAEETGDVLTLRLSPAEPTHHFHDYFIRFVDAYDDYVAITVTSAPRGVNVSEAEAVRIALQEAARRNRSFIGEQGRELRDNAWEIHFLCGADCGFVVKINATSGSVLGLEERDGR